MTARGEIRRFVYDSYALRTNALGDPSQRDLWCWLPPGYDESQSYPVLYVLAGFTGHGRGSLNDDPWSPGLDVRMERMLETTEAEPAILVFPDCFTRLGGSQYVNSSAIGRYEDYLCDELIPFIDEQLATKGDGHRGVLGKSSGGFAAMTLAMRRPGLFSAVASHSGDCAFELCYRPDFPVTARVLARCGGIDAFLDQFDATRRKTGEQIHALNVLAMAAAYSPHPANPDRGTVGASFELPFDLHDVTLRDDVWQRWLSHDPIVMVDDTAKADALRALDVLFIDVGTRDEYNLDFAARRLHKKLDDLEIRHRYEEFDDGHRGLSYRYERSIPLLSRMLT